MLKRIFIFVGSSLIRSWIAPQRLGAGSTGQSMGSIHPNTSGIKILATRYLIFLTLVVTNILLFVGGIIVTAIATAHSYDVNGEFLASSVFWTGLGLASIGIFLGALAGYLLLSTKISVEELFVLEPPAPALSGISDRLIWPFMEGVFLGLSSPRRRRALEENRTSAA